LYLGTIGGGCSLESYGYFHKKGAFFGHRVKLFRDAMYAALKDKLPPDVWNYPTP
jgi:hypothetical protein